VADPPYDLVVRAGTVVAAGGSARCDLAVLARGAAVDHLVHPGFAEPDDATLSDIAALADAGHRSLKTVTLFLDRRGDELVRAVALAGSRGMLTLCPLTQLP